MLDPNVGIKVITSSVDAGTVRTGISSRHMHKTMLPPAYEFSTQFTTLQMRAPFHLLEN